MYGKRDADDVCTRRSARLYRDGSVVSRASQTNAECTQSRTRHTGCTVVCRRPGRRGPFSDRWRCAVAVAIPAHITLVCVRMRVSVRVCVLARVCTCVCACVRGIRRQNIHYTCTNIVYFWRDSQCLRHAHRTIVVYLRITFETQVFVGWPRVWGGVSFAEMALFLVYALHILMDVHHFSYSEYCVL